MPKKVNTGSNASIPSLSSRWSYSQHKTYLMVLFCSQIQTRLGEKTRTSHALLITCGLVFAIPTLVQAQIFYGYFTHPLFGQSCTWSKWAGVWKCHWSGQNWFYHSPKFYFLHIFAVFQEKWLMKSSFFELWPNIFFFKSMKYSWEFLSGLSLTCVLVCHATLSPNLRCCYLCSLALFNMTKKMMDVKSIYILWF